MGCAQRIDKIQPVWSFRIIQAAEPRTDWPVVNIQVEVQACPETSSSGDNQTEDASTSRQVSWRLAATYLAVHLPSRVECGCYLCGAQSVSGNCLWLEVAVLPGIISSPKATCTQWLVEQGFKDLGQLSRVISWLQWQQHLRPTSSTASFCSSHPLHSPKNSLLC